MTTGERGPMGDHGQDGRAGVAGAPGRTGERGRDGAKGDAGKDVLTKRQTLVLFLFVVLAFTAVAYRSELNDQRQRDSNDRREIFLDESCKNAPELTPRACAIRARSSR